MSILRSENRHLMNNSLEIARKETSRTETTTFFWKAYFFLLKCLIVQSKQFSTSNLLGWGASTIWCPFAYLKSLWQQAIDILSNNHKANQKVYRGLELDTPTTLHV